MTNKNIFPFLAAAFFVLTPCSAESTVLGEHAGIIGPFSGISDVTVQCLQCHPQAGEDILRSSHWTWKRQRMVDGEKVFFSKKNGLTTFAVAAGANPNQCLTCHISTNLLDERFDPTMPTNIDCLVCHDSTGMYRREAGAPVEDQDLVFIARNVGRPATSNCLTCHGTGKNLEGRKIHHGVEPDVHMEADGANLSCQHCHPSGESHAFSRELTSAPGIRQTKGCAVCHTESPHRQQQLNHHAQLIDCKTCHIPAYGLTNPAVISWNWLSPPAASVRQQGEDLATPLLNSEGIFQAKNLQPVYLWDNGADTLYTRGKKTITNQTTVLQEPTGRTVESTIAPFSVAYGSQLIDGKYRYLISPTLHQDGGLVLRQGEFAEAAEAGMKKLRLPFSGKTFPAATVSYRRLNHGVAKASNAVGCMGCHGINGRMDWPSLGYAMDPWHDQDSPAQNTITTPQPDSSAPLELPPIRETVLPVEPGG